MMYIYIYDVHIHMWSRIEELCSVAPQCLRKGLGLWGGNAWWAPYIYMMYIYICIWCTYTYAYDVHIHMHIMYIYIQVWCTYTYAYDVHILYIWCTYTYAYDVHIHTYMMYIYKCTWCTCTYVYEVHIHMHIMSRNGELCSKKLNRISREWKRVPCLCGKTV